MKGVVSSTACGWDIGSEDYISGSVCTGSHILSGFLCWPGGHDLSPAVMTVLSLSTLDLAVVGSGGTGFWYQLVGSLSAMAAVVVVVVGFVGFGWASGFFS